MTINIGDSLPNCDLTLAADSGNPQVRSAADLFSGEKLVLFAVPGAFTPTCSEKHLPGYVAALPELRARGASKVACLSVNDVFVMRAWRKTLEVPDELLMLADGSAQFTKACGLELDLTEAGLGIRSQRYALIAEDNVIRYLAVEKDGGLAVSSAEAILKRL